MKKYSKWMLIFSVIFISLIVLPGILSAQPADGDYDPDAPIDGGVGLLIAAGVGYGYKKYRNSRKNKPVSFK
jgi:hypothetical protein